MHFLGQGVNYFRVEFFKENVKKAEEVMRLCRATLQGKPSGTSVWRY